MRAGSNAPLCAGRSATSGACSGKATPSPVARALDTVRRPGRREAARHRRLERLRDALLAGDGEAFDRIREAMPHPDFRKLRQLVAAARREREEGAPGDPGARRLFRFLRDNGLEG